ncbi:MAG: twin-arginine translocase TatA/TatE family subunit [Desulfobulbus sp.]|jgi:sec-independent protein translocase protein TatA
MFGLGAPELALIVLLAVLLFGAKRLPDLGAGLGKALGAFRRETRELREVGESLKESVPGVKEYTEIKETVDKVKDLSGTLRK